MSTWSTFNKGVFRPSNMKINVMEQRMDVPRYSQSLLGELEALKDRVRQFIHDHHWLTDGEWKEGVLRNFPRRNLPNTVEVGRGFVVTDAGVSRPFYKRTDHCR
jgi:hypothetical protein